MTFEDAFVRRDLPDGRVIVVYRQPVGYRLGIGRAATGWLDDSWVYLNMAEAIRATELWDGEGEPPGLGAT